MRTTVRLDEKLLKEVKRHAAESGMTLTAVIEQSLRERLARKSASSKTRTNVRLHAVGKGGLHPGIDLDDSASLLDAMERKV
jgi:hypothetical protein